ncbi:MAG: diphosphomevalonate decarboxylase [Candidatus Aenigmarchaeota archaeon]|nr:diphosphomevalonate decarboxylase [Candidatus Aenigmarchaeota archaeon]
MKGTAIATPNIALIKYWGKRNEKLILPTGNNISFTLDEQLATKSTVEFSEKYKQDELWINGKNYSNPEQMKKSKPQLDFIREIAGINTKAKVVAESLVPVAGGLAGSASGLCAQALAAAKALNLRVSKKQLSIICRIGSGSACRSVYGGFVEWEKGESPDGSDSHAIQIADENHWPEFRCIIAIVEKKEKKVKSRAGMKKTVETSVLYPKRIEYLPLAANIVRNAILKKDLPTLLEATMRDSNNMHSVMLDTWPPIIYLNDVSKQVINSIHDFNSEGIKAGYSFDAGPNPTIFTVEKHVNEIKNVLKEIERIKDIIVSKSGKGPRIVEDHLI